MQAQPLLLLPGEARVHEPGGCLTEDMSGDCDPTGGMPSVPGAKSGTPLPLLSSDLVVMLLRAGQPDSCMLESVSGVPTL